MLILKVTNTQPDGSKTFDVELWDDTLPVKVTLRAISEKDADQFVEVIALAIADFTDESVEVDFRSHIE